jgi:hypothetical protein
MKRERIVEFVGGNEEEVAYLRLLLRKAARQLLDRWRLRREDDAHVDLLIIDDISDVAALPGSREAQQRRVRLIDPAVGATGMETLIWPLSQEVLTTLFNQASFVPPVAPVPSGPVIQQNAYDDLFEPDEGSRWTQIEGLHEASFDVDNDWLASTRAREAALTQQAEQLFRDDPRLDHKDVLKSIRLHDAIDIEATDGHTVGGGNRKERRAIGDFADTAHARTADWGSVSHPLSQYLSGKLLPGPARIEACHVVLTVDPRNRQYYAKGGLCIFEDCCKQALRRGDWHSLSADEFAQLKAQIDGRPFAELLWLSAYLDHPTGPADDLDVDLRYRLIQSIDLQRDYPRAARIAQELQRRTTLRAAAAACGVSLDEARRVASAFDSIGFLIPD